MQLNLVNVCTSSLILKLLLALEHTKKLPAGKDPNWSARESKPAGSFPCHRAGI